MTARKMPAGVEAQLEMYEGQSHAQYLVDDRLPKTAVTFGEMIDRRLTRLPPLTPPGDVRPVLFGGAKAFF